MKANRLIAMLIRNWYGTIRSYDRLTDSFYWITLDLVLWGITGGYVQGFAPDSVNIFFMITASVILWNVTFRGQNDIGIGLLDELWNKNLINLFATPLMVTEWIASLLILSSIKAVITVAFGTIVAMIFYQLNIFELSFYLVPFFLLLLMSGWWIGFLICGLILRYTTKVQALAWTFVWVLAPLSAIYFPVSSLPTWAQLVSKCVPMSYVFEEMRGVIVHDQVNNQNLVRAFALNIIYLTLSAQYLRLSFNKVLERGLIKVY
ncbi:MAG: hypothetical protein DCC75_00505 [Proteobacteria bacterium]|nr:MAG: hypothetical protein DCC75_00505 [Pseudomonadota bacterium]